MFTVSIVVLPENIGITYGVFMNAELVGIYIYILQAYVTSYDYYIIATTL